MNNGGCLTNTSAEYLQITREVRNYDQEREHKSFDRSRVIQGVPCRGHSVVWRVQAWIRSERPSADRRVPFHIATEEGRDIKERQSLGLCKSPEQGPWAPEGEGRDGEDRDGG